MSIDRPTRTAMRDATEVAAGGTDPRKLLRVVAFSVRPGRSPDVLRRRCHDLEATMGPADAIGGELDDADVAAARTVLATWRSLGVRCALVGDPAYPARLAEGWPSTDGPPLVAWRGTLDTGGPAVAIVGARRAGAYGTAVATWLADAVASVGVRVVSGGAVGIDAAAHRAALATPGGTTVVLGCGHAVDYPRDHARPGGLFAQVADHQGGLVSELLPGARPHAGHVRARNRLVAALSDVVVVVEGGARSGALLTAGAAADRGRPVLAVPGDVRAPGSVAPHRLLAEGAAPCRDPADILDHLAVRPDVAPGSRQDTRATAAQLAFDATDDRRDGVTVSGLAPGLHEVLRAAWPRPLHVEDLAAASGLTTSAVLAAVTRGRLVGELADGVDGIRLRRAPRSP